MKTTHQAYNHRRVEKRPAGATKWVATIVTSDNVTSHLFATKDELEATYKMLTGKFGEPKAGNWTWALEEVPATWVCDGRDNCRVQA